jgi:2-polyprenyl-3-methyl-5-hydroxy-6-metoxy-1,4-benzoquinol methylase
MTFAHKLRKALKLTTYTQARSVRGLMHLPSAWRIWNERRVAEQIRRRKQDLTVGNIVQGIDPVAWARLQARKAEENEDDVFWTKYLDLEKWLKLNIRYAHELGLVVKPPRSVLDLGCGGGFFLVVCRRLGARVLGMDLDKDLVLNELVQLFGLKRVTWRIRAFVKLPNLRRKFDLITAFMICFNFPPRGGYWGVREWSRASGSFSRRKACGGRKRRSRLQSPGSLNSCLPPYPYLPTFFPGQERNGVGRQSVLRQHKAERENRRLIRRLQKRRRLRL